MKCTGLLRKVKIFGLISIISILTTPIFIFIGIDFCLIITLHEIVIEKLGYHKFCVRWIPKLFTTIHKTNRMSSVIDFLSRYHFEEEFLERIVTDDETWVAYVNSETKQQLLQASQRKPSNFVNEESHGYSVLGS